MTALNAKMANTMAKVQKNQANNVASENPDIPARELMELYDKVHELFDCYDLASLVEHLNDMVYCWAEYSRKEVGLDSKAINDGVFNSKELVNFLVGIHAPYQKAQEQLKANKPDND